MLSAAIRTELMKNNDIKDFVYDETDEIYRIFYGPAPAERAYDCIVFFPITEGNRTEYNAVTDVYTFIILSRSAADAPAIKELLIEEINMKFDQEYGEEDDKISLTLSKILDSNPGDFYDKENDVYITQFDALFKYRKKE